MTISCGIDDGRTLIPIRNIGRLEVTRQMEAQRERFTVEGRLVIINEGPMKGSPYMFVTPAHIRRRVPDYFTEMICQ